MFCYDGQRVLILAPHADDEILGCGGIIQKYIAHGSAVRVVIASLVIGEFKRFRKEDNAYFTYSGQVRMGEMRAALGELGVSDYHVLFMEESEPLKYHGLLDTRPKVELVSAIENQINQFHPTVLFIPSRTKHQDHVVLYDVSVTAARPYFWKGSIVAYETDGEFDFRPNLYVPLSGEELERKCTALSVYKTQVMKSPHPVSPDAVSLKAQFRAQDVYETYSEAFQILRLITHNTVSANDKT